MTEDDKQENDYPHCALTSEAHRLSKKIAYASYLSMRDIVSELIVTTDKKIWNRIIEQVRKRKFKEREVKLKNIP